MFPILRSSALYVIIMTALCGMAYPFFIEGVTSVTAPRQRTGSLVMRHDTLIGSALVGQTWRTERYFHGRPSAVAYQPLPSGGTNRTIASIAFRTDLRTRRDSLAAYFGVRSADIPSDLVTASASGIDPHISPEAARCQVDRIASVRGLTTAQRTELTHLITQMTEPPSFGLLGRWRINVLRLNLALDEMAR